MAVTESTPTVFNHGLEWEEGTGYAQAVRRGDTVYISGQFAHDPAGNFLGRDDFEAQARATYANIDLVLAHFGADRSALVSLTEYVKHLPEHFKDVIRLHTEYIGDARPTLSIIGVADLSFRPQLIEIQAVAVLD